MDYCGLGSVKDIMKCLKRPFVEAEIASVLFFVLQGLVYLHAGVENGPIIHRDLKSANILVANDGAVKIGKMRSKLAPSPPRSPSSSGLWPVASSVQYAFTSQLDCGNSCLHVSRGVGEWLVLHN